MASNISTIGFAFADAEEFGEAMAELAGKSRERLSTPDGEYAIWRSRSGAEIWFLLGPESDNGAGEREIVGLNPFYEGKSEVPVKVNEPVRRPDDPSLAGGFSGWVNPQGDDDGDYPIVFDAVDFGAHSGREMPAVRNVRLTGFAHELLAYESADAFNAAQTEVTNFAAQSFFPVGLIAAPAGRVEPGAPPTPTALMTGKVVEHQTLTNEETGREFKWLLVESLSATFDIVADPEIITGEIVDGGTIQVSCWIFGRMLD